ncbi:choice-of-anchor J domain-containing protein [Lacinutrix jangbogonensis]|uniref:choice-of-anchor J domain-containing protein n=1 Tax=Lacinutrix jangbogonensis TaxID=1469557 RepID=UPI00053E694E|nr:choice-of-anchor J domain-containing protein [Lacinutrix jangbogonensis]
MKKVIYLLVVVAAIFTGCNPLEDINNEIDALPQDPNVGSFEYTVTDEDYSAFDLGFGSFDSEQQVKDSIPDLLSELYPLYGQGSSVLVNYNLYIGNAEGVSDFTGSDVYSLTNSDYASTGSDAFGFYPNVNAASQIPDVLTAQVASPIEGQIVLAKYKQYTENPVVGLANLIEYNFAGSFEGWSIAEEFGGDDVWVSDTGNVKASGFFGGTQVANTEWLVSPSIDLSGEDNLKFQITQELDFASDVSLVKILVSTDYTSDVLTANWDEITLANPATGDMAASEDYDFSAYDGQTINIAFKYTSIGDDPSTPAVDEGDAGRWRIASLAIKTLGATGNTTSKGEYFMYSSGDWELVESIYYLSSADYDSMGTSSGQPGQYNNFSSSASPNNYLPTFLELNFPYGQDDEELFVIYDYFSSSSGAQRRGNLYTFTGGLWNAHESTIETSLQFGFDNGVWVPDNTIRHTLVGADYEYISTAFAAEPGFEAPSASVAQYSNFDRRPSNDAYWSDEMLATAMGSLLDNSLATGAADGQKYVLSFAIYDGSSGIEDFKLIKEGGVWIDNN